MTPIRTLTLLLAAVPFLSSLPGQAPAVPTKPAEPAVYDEAADARQQIAKAVTKAKHENQRVLIEWGANWCGWCKWLAATMKKDPGLSKELMYEYQVVHIDVGHFDKHMDVAKELGASWKGIPYLTILDADGKPIAQADTEPFEAKIDGKNGHDAAKVVAFLKQHEAKPLVAADVLAAALATAQKEQKRVFLHFGAPWCGWCHRLENWMAQPEIAALLGKDFIDLKIDNDRMTGGKDVYAAQLAAAQQKESGIPWFLFLDASGKQLAHSNGPKGNTGFPHAIEEVQHFVTMLQAVKKNLTDADIAFLQKSLDDIRMADEERQKKAKAEANGAKNTKAEPARAGGS